MTNGREQNKIFAQFPFLRSPESKKRSCGIKMLKTSYKISKHAKIMPAPRGQIPSFVETKLNLF